MFEERCCVCKRPQKYESDPIVSYYKIIEGMKAVKMVCLPCSEVTDDKWKQKGWHKLEDSLIDQKV